MMKQKAFKRYSKEKARMEWMRAFEEHLNIIAPHTRGRIDWDTATFLFNSGAVASEAAHRYAQTMIDIRNT